MSSLKKFDNAPGILVYEDYFDSGDFVNLLEKETTKEWPYLEWSHSKTGNGNGTITSSYRSSLEMPMSILLQSEVVEELSELKNIFVEDIFKPIDECIYDYRNIYDLQLKSDTGFNLLKYSHSAEYHIHTDHSSDNSRVLSLVACLGNEFEGGELEFNNFDLIIKLKKNSLVLFPSNFPYSHIAHPVTSGTKYSLVTWFI